MFVHINVCLEDSGGLKVSVDILNGVPSCSEVISLGDSSDEGKRKAAASAKAAAAKAAAAKAGAPKATAKAGTNPSSTDGVFF